MTAEDRDHYQQGQDNAVRDTKQPTGHSQSKHSATTHRNSLSSRLRQLLNQSNTQNDSSASRKKTLDNYGKQDSFSTCLRAICNGPRRTELARLKATLRKRWCAGFVEHLMMRTCTLRGSLAATKSPRMIHCNFTGYNFLCCACVHTR